MYYKLTMRDKRVVFAPVEELGRRIKERAPSETGIWGANFADRLKQIRVVYSDCVDWEMVEGNTEREAKQIDAYNDWAEKDTKKVLDMMAREGMVSEEGVPIKFCGQCGGNATSGHDASCTNMSVLK